MNDVTVILETANGEAHEIPPHLIRELVTTTQTPGGFWTADVDVDYPPQMAMHLFDTWAGGRLRVYHQQRLVWDGYLRGVLIRNGLTHIGADGIGRSKLRQIEIVRSYADPRYDEWHPNVDTRKFRVDNNNRIYITTVENAAYDPSIYDGYAMYNDIGGHALRHLSAHIETQFDVGDWDFGVWGYIGGSWVELWNTTTSGEVDIDVDLQNAESITFTLHPLFSGPGEAWAKATDVIVKTVDDTTSSAVITSLLDEADVPILDIQDTGKQMAYARYRGRGMDVIRKLAYYGDGQRSWVFVVYEQGAEYYNWGDGGNVWLVKPEMLSTYTIGIETDELYNAVRASMMTGWLSDYVTDEDSIDKYGYRPVTIELPIMPEDEALTLCQLYLEKHKEPTIGYNIIINKPAQKDDGGIWHQSSIRAGDIIRLLDVVPHKIFEVRVRETRWNAKAGTMRIIPEGDENMLEHILAARKFTNYLYQDED